MGAEIWQQLLKSLATSLEWSYAVLWTSNADSRGLYWKEGYYNSQLYLREHQGDAHNEARKEELFYLSYRTCSFGRGVGYPGCALMQGKCLWASGEPDILVNATYDQHVFLRAAGIQTIFCAPWLNDVLELGTFKLVGEMTRKELTQKVENSLLNEMKFMANSSSLDGLAGVHGTSFPPSYYLHHDESVTENVSAPVQHASQVSSFSSIVGEQSSPGTFGCAVQSLTLSEHRHRVELNQIGNCNSAVPSEGFVSPSIVPGSDLQTSVLQWLVNDDPAMGLEPNSLPDWAPWQTSHQPSAIAHSEFESLASAGAMYSNLSHVPEGLDPTSKSLVGLRILASSPEHSLFAEGVENMVNCDRRMPNATLMANCSSDYDRQHECGPENGNTKTSIHLAKSGSGSLSDMIAHYSSDSEHDLPNIGLEAATFRDINSEGKGSPPEFTADIYPVWKPWTKHSMKSRSNPFRPRSLGVLKSCLLHVVPWIQQSRSDHPHRLMAPPHSRAEKPVLVQFGNVLQLGKPSTEAVEHDEAARSHMLAERKRRERQNECLEVLRSLIPASERPRKDKVSILADTIRYVRQLQERVKQLEEDNETLAAIDRQSDAITSSKCEGLMQPPHSQEKKWTERMEVFPDGERHLRIEIHKVNQPKTAIQLFSCLKERPLELISADVRSDGNYLFASFLATVTLSKSTDLHAERAALLQSLERFFEPNV